MSDLQHVQIPLLWSSIRRRRSRSWSSNTEPQAAALHQPEASTSSYSCTCHRPKEDRPPQTLEELDERIEALQSELHILRTARNGLVPFHRLPQETIHMIFADVVNSSPGLRTPCILASVCAYWRIVALNRPCLWSYINNTPLSAIEMQLARALGPSAGGYLHVTYSADETSHAKELLLTLKHLPQIRSLNVTMYGDNSRCLARYRRFSAMLKEYSTPLLRSLSLRLPQWPAELTPSLPIAPQLSEISLTKTPLAPFRAFFGHHLRRLCVDNAYSLSLDQRPISLEVEEWVQVLTLHPVLEELSLAYAIVMPFDRPPVSLTTVTASLPHLRQLHLCDRAAVIVGLMRHIDVSVLYNMKVRCDIDTMDESCLEEVKRLAKSTLLARSDVTSPRIISVSRIIDPVVYSSSLSVNVSMNYCGVDGESSSHSVEVLIGNSSNDDVIRFAKSIVNTSFCQMFNPSELRVNETFIDKQDKNAIVRILGSLHSIQRLVVVGPSPSSSPFIIGLFNMDPRRKERLMGRVRKLAFQDTSFSRHLVGHIIGAFMAQGFECIEVINGEGLELEFLELLGYIADRVLWDGNNS